MIHKRDIVRLYLSFGKWIIRCLWAKWRRNKVCVSIELDIEEWMKTGKAQTKKEKNTNLNWMKKNWNEIKWEFGFLFSVHTVWFRYIESNQIG